MARSCLVSSTAASAFVWAKDRWANMSWTAQNKAMSTGRAVWAWPKTSNSRGGRPSRPTTNPTKLTHIRAMMLRVAATAARCRKALLCAKQSAHGARPRAFTACGQTRTQSQVSSKHPLLSNQSWAVSTHCSTTQPYYVCCFPWWACLCQWKQILVCTRQGKSKPGVLNQRYSDASGRILLVTKNMHCLCCTLHKKEWAGHLGNMRTDMSHIIWRIRMTAACGQSRSYKLSSMSS